MAEEAQGETVLGIRPPLFAVCVLPALLIGVEANPITDPFNFLLNDHRIGAARHCRTGHDAHALSLTDFTREWTSCPGRAEKLQFL